MSQFSVYTNVSLEQDDGYTLIHISRKHVYAYLMINDQTNSILVMDAMFKPLYLVESRKFNDSGAVSSTLINIEITAQLLKNEQLYLPREHLIQESVIARSRKSKNCMFTDAYHAVEA